jgi:hypothetical protein
MKRLVIDLVVATAMIVLAGPALAKTALDRSDSMI